LSLLVSSKDACKNLCFTATITTSASLQRLGDKLPGAVAESAAPTKKRRNLAPAKSTGATETVQGIDAANGDAGKS